MNPYCAMVSICLCKEEGNACLETLQLQLKIMKFESQAPQKYINYDVLSLQCSSSAFGWIAVHQSRRYHTFGLKKNLQVSSAAALSLATNKKRSE